jgi:hypothetical protein
MQVVALHASESQCTCRAEQVYFLPDLYSHESVTLYFAVISCGK